MNIRISVRDLHAHWPSRIVVLQGLANVHASFIQRLSFILRLIMKPLNNKVVDSARKFSFGYFYPVFTPNGS